MYFHIRKKLARTPSPQFEHRVVHEFDPQHVTYHTILIMTYRISVICITSTSAYIFKVINLFETRVTIFPERLWSSLDVC